MKISFMAAEKGMTIIELFYKAILKTLINYEHQGVFRDILPIEETKFIVRTQFIYMSLRDFI